MSNWGKSVCFTSNFKSEFFTVSKFIYAIRGDTIWPGKKSPYSSDSIGLAALHILVNHISVILQLCNCHTKLVLVIHTMATFTLQHVQMFDSFGSVTIAHINYAVHLFVTALQHASPKYITYHQAERISQAVL